MSFITLLGVCECVCVWKQAVAVAKRFPQENDEELLVSDKVASCYCSYKEKHKWFPSVCGQILNALLWLGLVADGLLLWLLLMCSWSEFWRTFRPPGGSAHVFRDPGWGSGHRLPQPRKCEYGAHVPELGEILWQLLVQTICPFLFRVSTASQNIKK